MFYFKVQPPLPLMRLNDHGFTVWKSTSGTSICSATTPSSITIKRILRNTSEQRYKISRVNYNYFKKATGFEPPTTNIQHLIRPKVKPVPENTWELSRMLIAKIGEKIGNFIITTTKMVEP